MTERKEDLRVVNSKGKERIAILLPIVCVRGGNRILMIAFSIRRIMKRAAATAVFFLGGERCNARFDSCLNCIGLPILL